MERKILFQISREKEDKLSFTSNELTSIEMYSLVSYLKSIIKYFEKELEIEDQDFDYKN